MKITGTITAAILLATTEAFAPIGRATVPSSLHSYTLPQENGVWPSHTQGAHHIDTRHTILPQELGVWPTSPPKSYAPPHREHIDTRKTILAQELKGIWPTTPPPGWVCPKPEGCSGEDIREAWESYAPYHHDGKVGALGFVGCPGGGDWCYGSSGPARSGKALPGVATSARSVAATLAGLGSASGPPAPRGNASGPPKRYGLGSWKNTDSSQATTADSYDSLGDTSWSINSRNESPPSTKLRRPIVAGNWKLNPSSKAEAITLLKLLASNFLNNRNTVQGDGPETVIFPPLPYLAEAVQILEGTGIQVGAQDVGSNEKGAFTGEVAPSMLVSSGCSYVLLGHSERRTLFGETDEDINAKLHKSLEQPGLKVILCVGETLQEYQGGLLETVVDTQIRKGLEGVDASMLLNDRVIIAYEPVWAIGTGLVATPAQAQHAHVVIRSSLASMYGAESGVAESIRIQYGGSVTPDSIEDLMGEDDLDGALVGGASLNADSFTRIFDGATTANAKKKGFGLSNTIYQPLELTATLALATTNALGESPVWSDRDQCLYWVSATEGEVWRWNLHDQPHRRLINSAVGCVGLLQSSTPGSVIIATESGILTTSMITPGADPNSPMPDFATGPAVLCNRPDHMSTTRPNDGRVDRFGNFVVGMYNQYHRAGATAGENNAGLFRLNSQTLHWEEILDYRFRVSNCICFSPDSKTMYFGDTPTRTIYAFDYSPDGPLTNRRMVWTMPSDLPGGPDGAQVDSNGKLWVAVTGAGRAVQLDPASGQIEMIVHLDANPTSLTFGGPNLDELFITTRAPNGGGLYRVKMPYGVRGVPEPEFRGGGTWHGFSG